jgi:CelD/BcsL family acetyltransferase involved in cellulose biosynthesis
MPTIDGLRHERRYGRACDVAVTEGSDAITAVASAWRSIEDAGGVTTPFQSFIVAQAAARAHVADGGVPRIVTVRQGGRPVVIFATVVSRRAGLSTIKFLGDPFIQYGDVIAAPEASPEHLEAAWSAAVDPRAASIANFRKVRADSKIAPLLARMATTVTVEQAPFVDVRHAPNLKSHHKRELRRLRRRLAGHGELRLDVVRGAAVNEVLREALDFKRAWLVERGLPSSVFGRAHWEQLLVDLVGRTCGHAEMMAARLTVGRRTAAIEIGFADAWTWFAYIGAIAQDFAKFGAGHIQMEDTIEWCREAGLAYYDLLPPSQFYKQALATGTIEVCDYAVPLSIAGYPAILASRLAPAAKDLVRAMPLSLRRLLFFGFARSKISG